MPFDIFLKAFEGAGYGAASAIVGQPQPGMRPGPGVPPPLAQGSQFPQQQQGGRPGRTRPRRARPKPGEGGGAAEPTTGKPSADVASEGTAAGKQAAHEVADKIDKEHEKGERMKSWKTYGLIGGGALGLGYVVSKVFS
jgi:hypothetical protein